MSKLEDRRKEARELVVSFTLVYESTQGKLLGYLRDLTMNGARVGGSKALAVGSAVSLSIELPRDLPVVETHLYVEAKVARCEQVTEDPPNYDLGFEFSRLKPEQSDVIEKLLKRYYFKRSWT